MLKILRGSFVVLSFALCLWAPPVLAISPTEQVQETLQQVLAVAASSPSNEDRRRAMLRDALLPRFDWLEMAKQALGKNWSSADGRETEFVSAFAEFLGNSYIGQIASYRNEKIIFVKESIDHNHAQVRTKIISGAGEPTAIDYRLHLVQGEWKIYDVVVEDISIVDNYRAQFNRVLAKGNLDDLMRRFKEKENKRRN